jgi:thiol-disulfide isomerase/thioredoxin
MAMEHKVRMGTALTADRRAIRTGNGVLCPCLWRVVAWAALAAALALRAAEATAELRWYRGLDAALTAAAAEYRPVLAVFSGPGCGWCRRLREETLTAPEVVALLRLYVLVEVDVTEDPAAARQFEVSGVPTLLVLRGDGQVVQRLVGFLGAADLVRALSGDMTPSAVRAQDPATGRLIGRLLSGSVAEGDWPALMLSLGRREWRDEVVRGVEALTPFPRQALVQLLEDPLLAVRLGALELLETVRDGTMGFDPWRPQADESLAGLARWRDWAAQMGEAQDQATPHYTALAPAEVTRYIEALVSADRERGVRALRMLAQAGPDVGPAVTEYLESHPDLPPGRRNRVREARYLALLPPLPAADSAETAHRLVFGTLDARLGAIASLAAGRGAALPLLTEFLDAPEAEVREAAVDALVATRLLAVVPVLDQRLQREKDRNVCHAVLRGLGTLKSRRGQAVLLANVSHPDEDLAVAALQSLARQGSKTPAQGIVPCLADPRWRVRAAALETVAKLRPQGVSEAVSRLLEDPDEFVRHAAVDALASADGKKAAPRLEAVFLAQDQFKPAAVAALLKVQAPLPASFGRALAGRDTDVILGVLQAMDALPARDLWLARSLAAHENPDVAAAALRVLARCGLKDGPSRACLVSELQHPRSPALARAVLEAAVPAPEDRTALAAATPGEVRVPATGTAPPAPTPPADTAATARDLFDAFGAGTATAPGETRTAATGTAPPAPTPPADTAATATDLFDAFGAGTAAAPGEAPQPPPASGARAANPAAEAIAAFVGADTEATPGTAPGKPPQPSAQEGLAESTEDADAGPSGSAEGGPAAALEASLREFGLAALPYLEAKHPEDTRYAAALLVTRLGSQAGIGILEAALPHCTAADRQTLARDLLASRAGRTRGTESLLQALLDDAAPDVRSCAASACLESGRAELMDAVFTTALRPGASLRPWDVLGCLGRASDSGRLRAPERLRHWARALLAEADATRQALGLILVERTWHEGDTEVVEPFIRAASPWLRRAAWHALGVGAKSGFAERLDAVVTDADEWVRLVLPGVYGTNGERWVDYLDAEHFERNYMVGFARTWGARAALPAAVRTALETLAGDAVPRVRFEAMVCLLENRVSLDLTRLVAAIEALPDRKAAGERVAGFVVDNYRELGRPFRVLLPYVAGTDEAEWQEAELRQHFGTDWDEESTAAAPPRLARSTPPEAIPAEFLPPSPAVTVSGPRGPVQLLYFHSPGCQECERVTALLAELREAFPALAVESLNIRTLAAARLNEALCERFGVPERRRLVTPAVFCSAGPLTGEEITLAALGERVSRAQQTPREGWAAVPDEELAQADAGVTRRYTALNLGVVAAAGLLDGVNPCAFATILFLVSFLQMARRRPREIAQVGGAFVAGVFLAYAGLGLGLIEVLGRLQTLRHAGHALNLFLAATVLVIAILNVRDGILCLQGRLGETALQLPDVLKRRIHWVVRVGARQRHVILAAFGAGVVISFLELACTGQVYAPTLVFMLKSGRDTWGALGYLLAYNVAFVGPLVAVFALAWGGLRSATLSGVFQRHAAWVKFATAGLFLVLFALFVFGVQLSALAA